MNKTIFDTLFDIPVGDPNKKKKLGDFIDLFPIITTFLIMCCCCLIVIYLMLTCGSRSAE